MKSYQVISVILVILLIVAGYFWFTLCQENKELKLQILDLNQEIYDLKEQAKEIDVGNQLVKVGLIRVSNPFPNENVVSPLQITGKARGTWFSEGEFSISLLDSDGTELGTGIAHTGSDWMTENFVPFEAKIEFQEPTGERGALVFEKANPSGLPENADELRFPISF